MDYPNPIPKPTIWEKPCRWGKNPAQQQKNAQFPNQKYPLTKYQFPIQASFIAVVIAVVSFF